MKLTKKQEFLITQTRDEWLTLSQTQKDITIQDVEKGVEQLYALDGRKKPLILILNDPLQCQYLANILSSKKGEKIDSHIGSQIYSQIYSQIDSQIRSQIRSQIYSQIYSHIGSQIYSQIYSQIDSQIHSQIDSQIDSQIYSQIDSQIDLQIRSQIYSQIDSQIDSQIYSQIDSQIHSQIHSQIDSQIDSQIYSQIYSQKLKWQEVLGGISWRGAYLAEFDYYMKSGLLNIKPELQQKVTDHLEFLKKGIWELIVFENVCIISKCPKTKRDDVKRLHSTTSKAVEFASGYGFYCLHGVPFEEKLFKKIITRKISSKELLSISNTDQRFVATQFYGFENILDKLSKKLLNTSKYGTKLYSTIMDDIELRFITYPDIDNTKKQRISFVDPVLKTADEAMAWKFHMSVEQYHNLQIIQHLKETKCYQ